MIRARFWWMLTFAIFNISFNLGLLSSTTYGATIRVPEDQPTIQSGIDVASDGDTVIVSDGTYTSTGNKDLETKGKAITVRSQNGPELCIIDCQGDGRGFFINNETGVEKETVISGFTITNSSEEGISSGYGLLTVANCIITNCSKVGINAGSPSTTTMITNCVITNNGNGGIFCRVTIIRDCIISNNTSYFGGGITLFSSGSKVINCVISGNQSLNDGGGIVSYGGNETITNCTITGNSSLTKGGAIAEIGGYNTSKINNSILWGNSPEEIYTNSGITVKYSDIQGGYAGEGNFFGDPLFIDQENNDFQLDPNSPCIDSGSSEDAPGTDINGITKQHGFGYDIGAYEMVVTGNRRPIIDTFTTSKHEIKFPFEVVYTCIAHDTDGTIASYTIDYGDGNTDNNTTGIFTHTYLNAGNGYATCTVLDNSGNSTNSIDQSIYQKGITHVPADYSTIQDAIDVAISFIDFTVLVSDGVYKGEGNIALDFKGKAITVKSENGPEKTSIDCERYDKGVIFHNYETHESVLDGFTIINAGNFYQDSSYAYGGVVCNYSSPTIKNCIIKYSNGSGIYIYGSPEIINCIIADNVAQDGGGIYCGDGKPVISNCIIKENLSTANYGGTHGGGGIFSTATPIITNCIIEDNIAFDNGGGIFSSHSNYTLTNCTIAGNMAYGQYGWGGIYHYTPESYAPPEITNSIIWGNSPYEINPGAKVIYSNIRGGYEGEGNISEDPLFYNLGAGDLRIASNSSCIDAATSTGATSTDIDGTIRPQGNGYDIGAYEIRTNNSSYPVINLFSANFTDGTTPLKVTFTCTAKDTESQSLSYKINYGDGSESTNSTGVFIYTYTSAGKHYAECQVSDSDGNNISSTLIKIQSHGNILVPEDYDSIQAAINASFDGDTVLVSDGTYTGPMNTGLSYHGKSIILQSKNGPENCVIDSQGYGQGVTFSTFESSGSILSGFSIINSVSSSILCDGASPIINNCIIRDTVNDLWGTGLGIEITGYSAPKISNCYILNNQGGGIDVYTSYPIIVNCVIKNNTAGGGIESFGSDVIVSNCIISENNAFNGGGLSLTYSYLEIENSIISNNVSEQYGGGVYCYTGPAFVGANIWIKNCTFSGNKAGVNGGGSYFNIDEEATVQNSIFWGDSPDEIIYQTDSSRLAPTVLYSDVQGGYAGEENINALPLFVSNSDYHLTSSSPCINAGTSSNTPNTDIDGDARPQGGKVDIGADEYFYNDGGINLSDTSIAENQSSGMNIGTFLTTDLSTNNTYTYGLVSGTGSTDNSSFTINGNKLLSNAVFDYETKNSYTIRVRSTNSKGGYYEKIFGISITDVNENNNNNEGGSNSGGGGGGGIFGTINVHDVIGYHLDGVKKDGTRVYMPVTEGFKALKGAQTQIEGFAPGLARIIRGIFDSLENKAESNKNGLLYKTGTYLLPLLGKIAEYYLEIVGSKELMINAYSNTTISISEFDKLHQYGMAIAPHVVTNER
jgi:parallel beta-helix repeat protein